MADHFTLDSEVKDEGDPDIDDNEEEILLGVHLVVHLLSNENCLKRESVSLSQLGALVDFWLVRKDPVLPLHLTLGMAGGINHVKMI